MSYLKLRLEQLKEEELKQEGMKGASQKELSRELSRELLGVKPLTRGLLKLGGRNSRGVITTYHRGGGTKQRYRIVDYKRGLVDVPGRVLSIGYDPKRTGKVALICYSNGLLSYILSVEGLEKGNIVMTFSGEGIIKKGCVLELRKIPVGTYVCNVEILPGEGGIISRAAGTYVQIMRKVGELVCVRLRSGEIRLLKGECRGTIGMVSNIDNKLKKLEKAGETRWRGRRPIVRGVAMNPVDHPHGGSAAGGRPSVSPWGWLTKGVVTRSRKKLNRYIVRSYRKKKK